MHCLHTSASLAINESYDQLYTMLSSGSTVWRLTVTPFIGIMTKRPDDMPAREKFAGLAVRLRSRFASKLALGTWLAGIPVCEHRDHGGARRLRLTASGSSTAAADV